MRQGRPSATVGGSAHHRLRRRWLRPAGTGPAIGCPARGRSLARPGGHRCLASGLPHGSGRCCKPGRRQRRRPRPANRLTTACVVGGSVQPPPGRPLAAQPLRDFRRGKGPSLPRFRPVSLPACLADRADAARPAAVSLVGHGQQVGSPPPALSGAPSSRHRAGRWLPSPGAVFGAAGGRRCLASGLPHGSGRCCKPARRQRRRPRPGAVAALLPACLAGRADAARPAALRGVGHGRRVGSPPPPLSVAPSAGTGPAIGCPAPGRSLARPEAIAASLPACLTGRADVASPAAVSGVGHGRRVGSPPPPLSVAPSSRHRARRSLLNRFRICRLRRPRLASGLKSLYHHPT